MEVNTSFYMAKNIDTNVSNEHSTPSKSMFVWVDLFNVYNFPILFVPFVVYRRKQVQRNEGCPRLWSWWVRGIWCEFWLLTLLLPAVGFPAGCLNSFSLSIFDYKVGKWSFGGSYLSECLLYNSLELGQLFRGAKVMENTNIHKWIGYL